MDKTNEHLISAVREALAEQANPEKAATMRAYMKSSMPFLGVQSPQQARAFRQVFAAHPLATGDEWRDTVLMLWRKARFREERYAGIALSGDQRYAAFQTLDALPIYEEMVVTGAWWDLVDDIAIHRVGNLLCRYPAPMRATMLAWSRDPDLWKRRTSATATSSSARRLAGRCASTPRPILPACGATSTSMRPRSVR